MVLLLLVVLLLLECRRILSALMSASEGARPTTDSRKMTFRTNASTPIIAAAATLKSCLMSVGSGLGSRKGSRMEPHCRTVRNDGGRVGGGGWSGPFETSGMLARAPRV